MCVRHQDVPVGPCFLGVGDLPVFDGQPRCLGPSSLALMLHRRCENPMLLSSQNSAGFLFIQGRTCSIVKSSTDSIFFPQRTHTSNPQRFTSMNSTCFRSRAQAVPNGMPSCWERLSFADLSRSCRVIALLAYYETGAACRARTGDLFVGNELRYRCAKAAHRGTNFGADGESRTPVIGLEAQGTSRYTTPARCHTSINLSTPSAKPHPCLYDPPPHTCFCAPSFGQLISKPSST